MEIERGEAKPLGDRVLAAERDEVLELLVGALRRFAALDKRITESWAELRTIYGYDAPEWSARPTSSKPPHRVTLRVGICLAADATFAPYSRGLLDAITVQQASLRIDIRSAATAIWAWASTDYPALSRSLVIARTNVDGSSMGFPAFATLYQRVLNNHLGTGIDDPAQIDEIRAMARALDRLTTIALEDAARPGRTPTALNASLVKRIAEERPSWISDAAEEDSEEVFAAGAAPLMLEVLLRRREPAGVARSLDALQRAMESAKGGQVGT
jgi:hypothetical protein